ncbi:MAG: hypothetical protein JST92_02630 [Deltaproteobacteria bacterium]|nr:hypothetical protein [Deltaproteobacteria bacterium]
MKPKVKYTWLCPEELYAELSKASLQSELGIGELLERFAREGLDAWWAAKEAQRKANHEAHIASLIGLGFKPKKGYKPGSAVTKKALADARRSPPKPLNFDHIPDGPTIDPEDDE